MKSRGDEHLMAHVESEWLHIATLPFLVKPRSRYAYKLKDNNSACVVYCNRVRYGRESANRVTDLSTTQNLIPGITSIHNRVHNRTGLTAT